MVDIHNKVNIRYGFSETKSMVENYLTEGGDWWLIIAVQDQSLTTISYQANQIKTDQTQYEGCEKRKLNQLIISCAVTQF